MSDFLYDMLKSRQPTSSTKYVFPSDGKTGYKESVEVIQMTHLKEKSEKGQTIHEETA
ncbi:MAG: hypothetical protein ACD_44C00001G0002 [uncultured bacterium]|nr:MAG: hypothetical protein ACD_44C00001G0002 [uncultured bacterium]